MSRAQLYQPMGQPDLVPESRMHEILAKHKGPRSETPSTVQPEPLLRSALTWSDPKRTAETAGLQFSTCDKYSIDAAKLNAQWRFTAWRRPNVNLGCFNTAIEARAACENHLGVNEVSFDSKVTK